VGHKDGGPIHCFIVSTRNSNDLFIAQADRITRKGVVWLTSPTGKIRATILTATNAVPEVIADSRAAEFQQELEYLTAFITPPPWEDALHPLHEAAKFGAVSDVAGVLKRSKKALNKQDDEGQTPLASAVVQEEVDTVRYLLEQGADPNIPNKNGLTPLDHACGRNKAVATTLAKLLLDHGALVNPKRSGSSHITSLDWAISSDNTELTKLLIEHGADIKAAYDTGETPLHTAANRGDLEIAKLLIDHGADVNAKLKDGWTPLYYAAYSSRKEMVELLLTHGADINGVDIHGKTPLAWAQEADVKEVLRQHGAK
jgi:ankyrin repeat protein